MNENKTALLVAFGIVLVLLVLVGSGIMSNGLPSAGMMGAGSLVGFNWMWLPFLLLIVLTAILLWVIFGKKK